MSVDTAPDVVQETAPGLLARPYRAMTIGAVALLSLMAFEAIAVTTTMPTVAQALDGLPLYALAFGGTFAAGIVGMVGSGIWNDARGPIAPMWHGIAWFTVGLLITGTAQTMVLVVVGRVVQGIGSGLLSVAVYVIVARVYPTVLRARIFGAFAAAWVVPSLVGPAIAGFIVEYAGWRWVFLAVPPLVIPAALLMRPALRSTLLQGPGERDGEPTGRPGVRIAWAVGAALSAALLHYGGQQRGVAALVLFAVGLVGLGVSTPRLLPAGFLLARRGMPTVVLLRGLASASFVGAEVFVPLLLSRERGLSPAAAGLALTVGALAWSGGSWFQGRPNQPFARTTLLRAGMIFIVTGIGFVALTVSDSIPVYVGIAGWSAAGLGMGLVYPTLSVLTLELSTTSEQGRNSSALQLGDSLFASTVLAVSGALFAAAGDPGPATYLAGFALAGGLALLGALTAGRATRT